MATAEQAPVTDRTTDEVVNTVVDAETSVAPTRYFTCRASTRSTRSSGSSATRTSRARTAPRSSRRTSSSQVLVADRDEHRRAEVLPRPHGVPRARALRQADDRSRRRHDRRLGPRGRLLRDGRGGGYLRGRAEGDPRQAVRLVQLAGLVQRRLRGEPAVQCMLHPLDRRLDGVDPRLDPPRGHHLPRRLGLRPQPLAGCARRRSSCRRAATPPGR